MKDEYVKRQILTARAMRMCAAFVVVTLSAGCMHPGFGNAVNEYGHTDETAVALRETWDERDLRRAMSDERLIAMTLAQIKNPGTFFKYSTWFSMFLNRPLQDDDADPKGMPVIKGWNLSGEALRDLFGEVHGRLSVSPPPNAPMIEQKYAEIFRAFEKPGD